MRNCPYEPLSKQPLALVLVQIRFSPILAIEDYIPRIQDFLRKNGYPFTNQKNLVFETAQNEQGDGTQIVIKQWRFESSAYDTVITIDKEQVVLQTSLYTKFEDFIESYISIINKVFEITEHDKFGIIVRLGLRYVDHVKKQNDTDNIDSYLRPELQGLVCAEYIDDRKQYSIASIGKTKPSDDFEGQLSIRIIRGEKGLDLPPDLIAAAPFNRKTVDFNEEIAIIDMDHCWMGSIEPKNNIIEIVKGRFFKLHDTIINSFYNSVVTKEGIEKWK